MSKLKIPPPHQGRREKVILGIQEQWRRNLMVREHQRRGKSMDEHVSMTQGFQEAQQATHITIL